MNGRKSMYTKEIPEAVFGASALKFADADPFFSESAPFCAMLASSYCGDTYCDINVTLIIDLAKKRFAFAPLHQSDVPELHPMSEEKGKLLLLMRDGSKRNVTKLIFHPLDKITKIESVSIKMNMFGNIQIAPKFSK
jgi:hypothetical protein